MSDLGAHPWLARLALPKRVEQGIDRVPDKHVRASLRGVKTKSARGGDDSAFRRTNGRNLCGRQRGKDTIVAACHGLSFAMKFLVHLERVIHLLADAQLTLQSVRQVQQCTGGGSFFSVRMTMAAENNGCVARSSLALLARGCIPARLRCW